MNADWHWSELSILKVFALRVTRGSSEDGYFQFWAENINIELLNISVSALGETLRRKKTKHRVLEAPKNDECFSPLKSNNFSNCLNFNQTNKLHDNNKDYALWGIADVGFNFPCIVILICKKWNNKQIWIPIKM